MRQQTKCPGDWDGGYLETQQQGLSLTQVNLAAATPECPVCQQQRPTRNLQHGPIPQGVSQLPGDVLLKLSYCILPPRSSWFCSRGAATAQSPPDPGDWGWGLGKHPQNFWERWVGSKAIPQLRSRASAQRALK